MSWTPFDRSNRSHWVDDMHSEEAGGGPSGLMSPTKTPGKNPWGALRSATKAASMILSRKVNAGGVRSLSFAEGSSDREETVASWHSSTALWKNGPSTFQTRDTHPY